MLPETPVIVGGNVAANAEVLLRLAKADYCVISEGEETSVELVNYLKGPTVVRSNEYRSMRAIMKELEPEALTESEANLTPLQLGR